MTIYAETSAVLRWLFAEAGGEALRAMLAAAGKVTASRVRLLDTHPQDSAIVLWDQRLG